MCIRGGGVYALGEGLCMHEMRALILPKVRGP